MALLKRTCERCGRVFTRSYTLKGGTFCSIKCKNKKLVPAFSKTEFDLGGTCEFCGVVLDQESFAIHGVRYCSTQCKERSLTLKQLEAGTRTSKTCKQCGQSFLVRTFREERMPQEFCNVECKKKYNTLTLSCGHCGKEFNKHKSHVNPSLKQYCSPDCRIADTHITKFCKTCGKEYSGPPSGMRSDVCSKECFKGPYIYRGRVTLTCDQCSKEFQKDASRVHILSGIFCSVECRRDFAIPKKTCEICGKEYRKRRQYAAGNLCSVECKKKITHRTANCAHCQKPFTTVKSKSGKFCSSKCAALSTRKPKPRKKAF